MLVMVAAVIFILISSAHFFVMFTIRFVFLFVFLLEFSHRFLVRVEEQDDAGADNSFTTFTSSKILCSCISCSESEKSTPIPVVTTHPEGTFPASAQAPQSISKNSGVNNSHLSGSLAGVASATCNTILIGKRHFSDQTSVHPTHYLQHALWQLKSLAPTLRPTPHIAREGVLSQQVAPRHGT